MSGCLLHPPPTRDSIPAMQQIRAAVTLRQGTMEVVDVEAPPAPGLGEVLIAPDAVGLCGSDFHYFTGDIGTIDDPSSLYPRIQGHEIAATIVEVGEECPPHLAPGMRVAVWPVNGCGALLPVQPRPRQRLRRASASRASTRTARCSSDSFSPRRRSLRSAIRIPRWRLSSSPSRSPCARWSGDG